MPLYHDQALIPLKLLEFGRAGERLDGPSVHPNSPTTVRPTIWRGPGGRELTAIEAILVAAAMVETAGGGA